MKRLVFYVAVMAGCTLAAQTTHNLDWYTGISAAEASLEIDEGDTVIWTFTDTAPHSVTSDSGSAEEFDSGIIDAGSTYQYTFTTTGDNPYHCDVHPAMVGTISVNALSVDERNLRELSIIPNPATSVFNLELPNPIDHLNLQVFDISGKLVYHQSMAGTQTSVNISSWGAGIYMVHLSNGKVTKTKRLMKR